MIAGILINIINLPGTVVVFIALLISNTLRDDPISWWIIGFIGVLTLLSALVDNLTISLGAKKMGAGRWGIAGAFLGMVVGLIVGGPVGAILGPFIGAFTVELLVEKKATKDALKAGLGTFIGFISAIVIKFGISVSIFSYWLVSFFTN